MAKKPATKKKLAAKKKASTKVAADTQQARGAGSLVSRNRERLNAFLARRPHRSFRHTSRRDYVRSLQLPGYWSFTAQVAKMLWANRRTLLPIVIVYGVLSAVFVGLASQETYTSLSDTLRQTSGDIFSGNAGKIGEAGVLLLTGVTGSLNTAPSEAQQIYALLLALLTWLTSVWLFRSLLAGQKPRFRDGLYNAGAPIVSTFLVVLVVIIQLLPAAIAAIGFNAAVSSGFLEGGVEAMVISVLGILLIVLSVYWITSTLIALVVVTLPGMYPMQALKTAGDLVISRRLRILLRWFWLILIIAVAWATVMIPIIIIDTWIKGLLPALNWLPVVPFALLVMGSFSIVVSAAYIYLLYRRIVEDDANPA